ncbi:MAG: ChbG/HpnK family deacetylase, partial [Planctomycetota bacterium]
MPHRLITRSDDAGTFRSANRAIRATCTEGMCRNISLMAPCPAIV